MPSVSAQYSIILRVEIDHRPGMLGRVATAIGEAGGSIGSVDLVGDRGRPHAARHHGRDRGRGARGADRRGGRRRSTARALVDITDRTFQMHVGGKIEQRNKLPVRTRDDLSMAYTPGVARVCTAIARRPRQGLPVHDQAQHGRRRLRRQRRARPRRHRPRGRDARDGGQGRPVQGVRRRRRVPDLPVAPRTRTRSSQTVIHIAPTFGGINLEDISAPRCFEIEERLKADARHPGLPRRPARHRGRHARRADQRRQADRQATSRTSRC